MPPDAPSPAGQARPIQMTNREQTIMRTCFIGVLFFALLTIGPLFMGWDLPIRLQVAIMTVAVLTALVMMGVLFRAARRSRTAGLQVFAVGFTFILVSVLCDLLETAKLPSMEPPVLVSIVLVTACTGAVLVLLGQLLYFIQRARQVQRARQRRAAPQ